MATLADISGGRTNWPTTVPQQNPMDRIANAILAADPRLSGIAIQQNGADATAAAPVAAGPGWAGPSPIPAYQRSGAQATMPGSREAWQNWGVPPIMFQTNPYATAAYRTFTDPYGQIGVQPLIGFPSAYPHVLSGVPNSPFRLNGMLMQDIPFTPLMAMMAMGQFPFMQPPATTGNRTQPSGRVNNSGTTRQTTRQPTRQTTQPVPERIPGGPYDETVWRNRTMPSPPPPGVMPEMTQLPPELGGNINTSPEAHAAGHAVDYPSEFRVDPRGQMQPIVAPSSFTPNLMTPEEAADTADGMYVNPNKSVWENILEAMGVVATPLSVGSAGAMYSAPRILGAEVVPQGGLPAGAAGLLP